MHCYRKLDVLGIAVLGLVYILFNSTGMFVKRPRRNEAEDDLLKFQNEFFSEGGRPSAAISRVTPVDSRVNDAACNDSSPCEENADSRSTRGAQIQGTYGDGDSVPLNDQAARPSVVITSGSVMKHEVVERKINTPYPLHDNFGLAALGFPASSRRMTTVASGSLNEKGKKRSIFARQMEASSSLMNTLSSLSEASSFLTYAGTVPCQTEHCVLESVDWLQIDSDNTTAIATMSPADVAAEQDKLKSTLDPKLYEFLQQRGRSHSSAAGVGTMATSKRLTQPKNEASIVKEQPDVSSLATELQRLEKAECAHLAGVKDDFSHDAARTSDSSDFVKASAMNVDADSDVSSQLPIRVDPNWVHMDTVETEKLEWMKSVKPLVHSDPSKLAARFDFRGEVVNPMADLPVHLGLHHHGLEPERGGYTLDELFVLARSINGQQRALALLTLANVVRNEKRGTLAPFLQAPAIPAMLASGLVFLLRSALDHSSEGVMTAAVVAFHALLVEESDERLLKLSRTWSLEMPCYTVARGCDESELACDEDITDEEYVKKDVVGALLRMNFLHRLRYVLEVWRPQAATVHRILDVLVRIAQTSRAAAYEVYKCPRLLACVLAEFAPLTWQLVSNLDPQPSAYGLPTPAAFRLVRIVASSSRDLAAALFASSHLALADRLRRCVVPHYSELQLPPMLAHEVAVEATLAWATCAYLRVGCRAVLEAYAPLMKKLQACSSDSATGVDVYSASIILLFSSAVSCTVTLTVAPDSRARKVRFENVSDTHPASADQSEHVDWSSVAGLAEPMEVLLSRYAEEFMTKFLKEDYNAHLLITVMNFFAAYFTVVVDQPAASVTEWQRTAERIADSVLVPLLHSFAAKKLYRLLHDHNASYSADSPAPKPGEQLPNLPRLDSSPLSLDSEVTRLHAVNVLLALMKLACAISDAHRGLAASICQSAVCGDEALAYASNFVGRVSAGCLVGSGGYFSRLECRIAFYLCRLAARSCKGVAVASIPRRDYHRLGMALVVCLTRAEEAIAFELLHFVIFHADFVSEQSDVLASRCRRLSLERTSQDRDNCVKMCVAHLPSIRLCYTSALDLGTVGVQFDHIRDTLFVQAHASPIAPHDWTYLPIVYHYEASGIDCTARPSGVSSDSSGTAIRAALHWICVIEGCQPEAMAGVNVAAKLARLMCVFLVDGDLFLERSVQTLLMSLLRTLCTDSDLRRMNFRQPIAGLASFYDLFLALLDQYEAASFGERTFANFLMLPLVQAQDPMFRKVFWGDHVSSARITALKITEVVPPIEAFLYPEETAVELVTLYWRALITSTVLPQRNEFLFLVAVHHLNRYVYTADGADESQKCSLLRAIVACGKAELVHHVLYYKNYDHALPGGLAFYDDLPHSRRQRLQEASSH